MKGVLLLTQKQLRFLREFLRSADAPQAALSAGYSPKDPRRCAARLLSLPQVQDAIRAARPPDTSDPSDPSGPSPRSRVVRELERLAFDYSSAEPAPKIQERLKALELLGRHLGMFSEAARAPQEGGVRIVADIP